MIEFNKQQKEAMSKCLYWWNNMYKQTFEISGRPGTGKTTIVRALIEQMGIDPDQVLFMAYIGKAVNALTRRGINARTVHSSIYDITKIPKLDNEGNILKKDGRTVYTTTFTLKEYLPPHIKLLVIDEGSTINKEMAKDILSLNIPVLILGDLDQLPPVIGNSFFLNEPDYIITQIMRQAENDPIIMLCQKAINGERIYTGKYGPKCFVIPKQEITDKMLVKSDIVLCARNSTRETINEYVRGKILGIHDKQPVKGDKLVCRKNNWSECIDNNNFLINGLVGYVEDVHIDSYKKKSIEIDFRPDYIENDYFAELRLDLEYLFTPYSKKEGKPRTNLELFEFAHAITVHLAQGSQYDNVFIYNEKTFNYNRWLYTAISRAASGLILAI